jgi:K+-sensing histidine kinase KdpD
VQRSFTAHAQCVAAGAGQALLLILWETTEMEGARRQAERSRERAELLASVAADLNGGVDVGAVLGTAVRRAAELLGAEDASVWLVDGENLRRTAERQDRGGCKTLPLQHLPTAQAVMREHEARLVRREHAAPLERAWMAIRRLSAVLVVPLVDQSGPMGILYLEYQGKRFLPGPADVTFAEAIAGQCALALGRARVFERERAARGRAEEAGREARWAERLQERIATVVGWDLQSSLRGVTLGVAALERRSGITDAERAILEHVASCAGQMERVIADLLDFARARAGIAIPVERVPVRLDEVARAAGERLAAAPGSGVVLEVEGDCALSGDAARLAQLVGNLYQQAHRHGAPGAPVRARLVGGPEEVTLEVEVEGLAAGSAALAQLFEPFHEVERDPPRGDLGLRLFIVREIARAHGGAVRVVPAGAVTLFQVVLPRRWGLES